MKIDNVKVVITRMEESSGNVQFFLRAVRTDVQVFDKNLASTLEYSCFQTKEGLTINECIERAIFEAQFLLRFFGLEKSDVEMQMCSNKNILEARTYRGYENIQGYNIQPDEYKYFGKIK